MSKAIQDNTILQSISHHLFASHLCMQVKRFGSVGAKFGQDSARLQPPALNQVRLHIIYIGEGCVVEVCEV